MREVGVETSYFAFQDTDGVLAFSLRTYEGEPVNPRVLFDTEGQVVLLRHPGQMIVLDALAEEFFALLLNSERVRFLETPEDSSEIIRQYDVLVVKTDKIILSKRMEVSA